MQDHPPAPGRARQRHPGTDGPAACGGAAGSAPQAWDHVRSRAVPLHLPLALAHVRAGAASLPLALAHVRAGAVSLLLAPPGQPGPVSADRSVPRSTDLSPAYLRRRLQAVLRRIAATPRHPDCPLAHRLNRHSGASMSRTPIRGRNPGPFRRPVPGPPPPLQMLERGPGGEVCLIPPPPVATGGPQEGHAPTTRRSRSITSHVHPPIQVPSRPPPATAGTGGPRQHLSRAPPPPARRKPTLLRGHRNVPQ